MCPLVRGLTVHVVMYATKHTEALRHREELMIDRILHCHLCWLDFLFDFLFVTRQNQKAMPRGGHRRVPDVES